MFRDSFALHPLRPAAMAWRRRMNKSDEVILFVCWLEEVSNARNFIVKEHKAGEYQLSFHSSFKIKLTSLLLHLKLVKLGVKCLILFSFWLENGIQVFI